MTEKLAVEVDVKNPDRGAGVVHLIYFVRIVGSLRLIAISHIVKRIYLTPAPSKVTLAYFSPTDKSRQTCISYFVQKNYLLI